MSKTHLRVETRRRSEVSSLWRSIDNGSLEHDDGVPDRRETTMYVATTARRNEQSDEIGDPDRSPVTMRWGRVAENMPNHAGLDHMGPGGTQPKARAPKIRPNRILIVDDDDSVRETLADLLESFDLDPIQACNAAEAVMLLRSDRSIDGLITDLSMPGADGITLIRQARAIVPNIPAILLTGYADQLTTVATIAGEAFQILRKPVPGDLLVEHISALLAAQ